jgi:23S rRNA pseudouridine2605 synthase
MNKDSPKPKTPTGERVAKVMARAGVASRRDAEKMIAAGRVAVNGKVIESPALNVTPRDRVEVDGRALDAPEPARLWMYHKPAGLVTTAKDEQGRPTIFDDLPDDLPRVMSVGRLDLNSEGLLLLTNDGGLKRKLELPSTGWLRRYRVRVKGNPTDAMLEPLREGIVVDREVFQPMQVVIDRQQGANAWLTVGLREGKNREIRRAMENIGLTVNRLIRVSYGPFKLGSLASGAVEEVRRRVLRDQLGLEPEEPGKPRPTRQRGKKGVTTSRPRAGTAGDGTTGGARIERGPGAGTRTGAGTGATKGRTADKKQGRGKDRSKDAPWGDGPRPKLTRRRPKKD